MPRRMKLISAFSLFALLAYSALFATEPEVITTAELARGIRAAIGLGPQECALLDMTAVEYSQLSPSVEAYCADHRATIEPLMEAVAAARKQLIRAYELNSEDIEVKEQAVIAATHSLATGIGSLVTSVQSAMGSERATAFARISQNRLLDSRVAFLELTAEQRTALRNAQRIRDRVCFHHKDRKNPKLVQAATEAYESTVNSILAEPQRVARSAMAAHCAERLPALVAAEAAVQSE